MSSQEGGGRCCHACACAAGGTQGARCLHLMHHCYVVVAAAACKAALAVCFMCVALLRHCLGSSDAVLLAQVAKGPGIIAHQAFIGLSSHCV